MKTNWILFFALSALLTLRWQASQAQTPTANTIGYADIEYIFGQLPEAKQMQTDLKSTETQLVNQVNAKTNELKIKYEKFVKEEKTMLEAIRNSTQTELQQLQANLEQLKQDAQLTLQKKQQQLMKPILEKIQVAIDAVAKENGYTFVLNSHISGQDIVIYADQNFDISDMVLKKLGIAPKVITAEPVKKQ